MIFLGAGNDAAAGGGVSCVAVEGVFWVTGEEGGGFLFLVTSEDVGVVSLGTGVFSFTRAFSGSSTF